MACVILAGEPHMKSPNTPRYSRHQLIGTRRFPADNFPLERFWSPLSSLATWKPVRNDYELIHSFNAIPITNKPWIVSYEEALPCLWKKNLALKLLLRERLALDNCRKIIAMSDYAKWRLMLNLKDWHLLDKVLGKVQVVHPNFPLRVFQPKNYTKRETLQLVFVGNDFARKGGIVALRVAKKVQQLGLPVKVHIVSQMRFGHTVVDHLDPCVHDKDLKLLQLSNVVFHDSLPNDEVLKLLANSHFQILASLGDTYGYSVIEGFSVGTPAITTNVCALPEFVRNNENGYLLHLKLSEYRTWHHNLPPLDRNSQEFWGILDSTYENLANQAVLRLMEFFDRPNQEEHYQQLSAGAIAQVLNVNESYRANDVLDDIYSQAIGEDTAPSWDTYKDYEFAFDHSKNPTKVLM
jgi:glycosyltransferase involved in cell wall biosynthesis